MMAGSDAESTKSASMRGQRTIQRELQWLDGSDSEGIYGTQNSAALHQEMNE